MKNVKLFFFPYAGGSATMIYKKWEKYLSPEIEIIPVELAGRGKRIKDSLYRNFNEAIDDIFQQVVDSIDNQNYAFFGHSMGALIAYEIGQRIIKKNLKMPEHLFFSGKEAPHISKKNLIHHLPEEQFKQEIINLAGIPDEVISNKDLMNYFMPIIKADYTLFELYQYDENNVAFDTDISILWGKEDEGNMLSVVDWERYSTTQCNFFLFNGGHFFLNEETENICKVINKALVNDFNDLQNKSNIIFTSF